MIAASTQFNHILKLSCLSRVASTHRHHLEGLQVQMRTHKSSHPTVRKRPPELMPAKKKGITFMCTFTHLMPPYVCVRIEYRNGGVGVRDTKGNAGDDNGQGQSTKQSALKR
jgi:hypothetical protein